MSLTIRYCPKCNWLLRSAWYAQEILSTFSESIGSVTLIPDQEIPGIFEIHLRGNRIWSRKEDGGFPEIKSLKQTVRDHLEPQRDLGHIDNSS